ncbi:hypothetical protein ATANTOWER_025550 [Ataeniobius toweri]|uniref:Uncharacterized protein n=1 Tax=Ataeniobius toweri TaxID=208326 RepID=A0ABU7C3T0_9TELE|nr:hypothetical protein [Ataeniobius toweri]
MVSVEAVLFKFLHLMHIPDTLMCLNTAKDYLMNNLTDPQSIPALLLISGISGIGNLSENIFSAFRLHMGHVLQLSCMQISSKFSVANAVRKKAIILRVNHFLYCNS